MTQMHGTELSDSLYSFRYVLNKGHASILKVRTMKDYQDRLEGKPDRRSFYIVFSTQGGSSSVRAPVLQTGGAKDSAGSTPARPTFEDVMKWKCART